MRVCVTGAAGRLGRAVLSELAAHGHTTIGLDREPTADLGSWDGRDIELLQGFLAEADALIHLAAIPAPWSHPDEVVFGNNTMATFAALTAAGRAGIRSVAIASSGSAYGTAWSPTPTRLRYVPVDEDHPMDNADPYGLSKEFDERTAQMAVRRWGMSVAALRFHWIATHTEQHAFLDQHRGSSRDWDEELRNLWGYVDIRDAACACRLAVEVAAERPYGFQALNIVAADALSEQPITELIAAHAPDIEIRRPLGPTDGAYAIERARAVIGWVPHHSWRHP